MKAREPVAGLLMNVFENEALERALACVKAAGYVVLKEKSYRQAQERQRIAKAHEDWAVDERDRAYVWARDHLTEERRLRERLTHVYGVAMKFGATHDDLVGPELPPGASR